MNIIEDDWSSRIDVFDCNIIDSHKNNDNDNDYEMMMTMMRMIISIESNSQGQMRYCKTN